MDPRHLQTVSTWLVELQDNFMEPDKVVVQSAPEDEEDHEPEDLAEGKLADKIPGKDWRWREFLIFHSQQGAFQIQNSIDSYEYFNT